MQTDSPERVTVAPGQSRSTLFRHRRRQRSLSGYLKDRLNRLRESTISRKIEYDLDLEWLQREMEEQNNACAVTGIPFDFEARTVRGPFSLSFERTDPNRGYTRDNTLLVCCMYNWAKNIFTHQDVVMMARALVERETVANPTSREHNTAV